MRRDHSGNDFHALTALHTQDSDGASGSANEQYYARRGRDHEEHRQVSSETDNEAVRDIRGGERDGRRRMDRATSCFGFRKEYLFLCGLQFTDRF